MHKIIRCISAVAVFISILPAAHAAGKLTVDPNSQPRTQAAKPLPVGASDKRLDKKVTIHASNARLHDVIATLSAESGVTIYCGKSNEDWQIRDIPVTVAAADIPLRRVLEYVVLCTNSVLTAKTSERGDVTYRVVMNPRLKQLMDSYLEAQEESSMAYHRQTFQMAAKLKDIPITAIKRPGYAQDDWPDDLNFQMAASKLIAGLDDKTIDSILSGEPLVLTLADAPDSLRAPLLSCMDAFDAMYIASMHQVEARNGTRTEFVRASETEFRKARIKISKESIGPSISGCVPAPEGDQNGNRTVGYGISTISSTARDNNNGHFAPLPELKYAEAPKPELPNEYYKDLAEGMPGFPAVVTLKLEDNKKPVRFADVLIGLSKAAGVPIVYTDFWTHQSTRDYRQSSGKELPFVQSVMKLFGVKWLVDTSTNAIIGLDNDWPANYRNLLPASILENLFAKAKGDGVELDDIVPISLYDKQASLDWIRSADLPDFPDYAFCDPAKKPIWAFYASLAPSYRSQVKSETGLSLARMDVTPIAQWIQSKIKINAADLYELNSSGKVSELKRLADPAVLANLTLRIETRNVYKEPQARTSAPAKDTGAGSIKVPPGFTQRTEYTLYVVGTDKDGEIKHVVDRVTLPYFHPDREKELADALRK